MNGINRCWSPSGPNSFFERFLCKLCEGDKDVAKLLQHHPFPDGEDEQGQKIVCIRAMHFRDSKFSRWDDGSCDRDGGSYWNDESYQLRDLFQWNAKDHSLERISWPELSRKLMSTLGLFHSTNHSINTNNNTNINTMDNNEHC